MERPRSKLKKLPIFQEKFPKYENQKFHDFWLLRENFSNITAKEKSFL